MKTTRVMSLVAATVFALGVASSAVAQTPATPAPVPAPTQTAPPAKGGDMHMEKKEKKAEKQHGKKKHAAKKAEGDTKTAPTTPAPAPEVKK